MDKTLFKITSFSPSFDKWIEVSGPELDIRVDYDDVDHKAVERNAKKMLKILNENWQN